MGEVTLSKAVERLHSPLAGIAAGVLGALPGDTHALIYDCTETPQTRRTGDRAVLLARADTARFERLGEARAAIAYGPHDGDGAVAALIAAGADPAMPICADPTSLATLMLAERVAASEVPVLIGGPTGTGKEVLARFIHKMSPRRDAPFVAINCAAMPEAMLEAMLFGHVKGAYTGASTAGAGFFRAADGGTLLLDEIAEMPIGLQAKLLRALQEREVVPIGATQPVPVNVRIIAAANRDLPTEVAEGRLRADLYYRLCVFPMQLTPLRERAGDIAPLAFAMLLRHSPPVGQLPWITPDALDRLRAHHWPGNVRELENVMRRAMVLAENGAAIDAAHISFDRDPGAPRASASIIPLRASSHTGSEPRALSHVVRDSEAGAIAEALDLCGGHRARTARLLGISERTLRYRLADLRDAGIPLQLAEAGGVR